MKLTYNWLKDLLPDLTISAKEIAQILTDLGLEVSDLKKLEYINNLKIGEILKVEKHPDADKLKILKIDLGNNDIRTLVTGAPNVNYDTTGFVVHADEGANLTIGKLKNRKIRGIVSEGMCCSEVEIGVGEDASGIIVLDEAEKGVDANKLYELEDYIFDIELTPNRGDCLGILGIAYELSNFLNLKINFEIEKINHINKNTNDLFKIEILNKNKCPIYIGRYIENIKVMQSSIKIQSRLHKIGLRPINNLVDISNYILMETGYPFHIFDADLIKGNKVIIRPAMEKEKILLLNSQTIELAKNDLVIADQEKPIALAGIMGSEESAVNSNTKNIFIESAVFHPDSVRKTSRIHNISSESSYRFERKVAVENLTKMHNRCVGLINNFLPDCEIYKEDIQDFSEKRNLIINFSEARFNKVSGLNLDTASINNLIKKSGLERISDNQIKVPAHRNDLSIEEDIYEEICRVYGYDNIPSTLPEKRADYSFNDLNKFASDIKNLLISNGFFETISYSFSSFEKVNEYQFEKTEPIKISNPLSEDLSVLRTDLLCSLLENLKNNLFKNEKNLRLFETGKVFFYHNNKVIEQRRLGIIVCCSKERTVFKKNDYKSFNFFDFKSLIEKIITLSNKYTFNLKIENFENKNFHPKINFQYSADRNILIRAGQLSFELKEELKSEHNIYYAEIYLDNFDKLIDKKIKFTQLPESPPVFRDLSIIVNKDFKAADILTEIKKSSKLIEEINIIDIYEDESFNENEHSITFKIKLREKNKTLTDEQANLIIEKIVANLRNKFNIYLKEG